MATGVGYERGAGDLMGGLAGLRFPAAVEADFNNAFRRMRHPYDLDIRERLADELLERHCAATLPGSFERAHLLLRILHTFYPTRRVSEAYFENLAGLLSGRQPLEQCGRVILGIGTGRCGSTSLAVAFRTVENALSTHENPPMIFWEPQAEQIGFHMKRLHFLARYYPVVFDAAHWWLNVLDIFLERFPAGSVVGLYRDTRSCVDSFLRFKGAGPRTVNHWATRDDKRWLPSIWDPCYPSYTAPPQYEGDTLRAKGSQIRWYVESYNRRLQELVCARPDRILAMPTERLGEPGVAAELSEFVNLRVSVPADRYNASAAYAMDSMARQQSFWF